MSIKQMEVSVVIRTSAMHVHFSFKSSFTFTSRIWQEFAVIKYGQFFQISKNSFKNIHTILQAFKRKKNHTLEISRN